MKTKIGMSLLLAGLILGGCSESFEEGVQDGEEQATEVVQEESETVEEVEAVEVVADETVEVVEEPEIDREVGLVLAEAIMSESFSELGDLSYDAENDAFTLIPTDPGFSQELTTMALGITGKDDWNFMVGEFASLSEAIAELVDENIGLAILNPENTDNIILLVRNGHVIYDFTDELNN